MTFIVTVRFGVLWTILGCGLGAEALVLLLFWYLHRKGWV